MDLLIRVLDSPTQYLSENLGVEETNIRLFVSLLYGYPVALFHALFLQGKNSSLQHVYYSLISVGVLAFNFGLAGVLNPLANILLVYPLLVLIPGTKLSVTLSNIINMGYLLYGYYLYNDTETYMQRWVTPQCVLTLKLIGLAWDIYDGKQKDIKGKEDTVIYSVPSFLEVLGFSLFTPALLVGPQFSFAQYTKYINGDFIPFMGTRSRYMIERFAYGLLCTLLHPLLFGYVTTDFMRTEMFQQMMVPVQLSYIAVWGYALLLRYLGVWLIVEGSCVLAGISYAGKDSDSGVHEWDRCCNIRLYRFNTATKLQHLIDGFNVNTNRWMLRYVYKRLRFMNNRHISQFVTMVFLSLWHGFHTGYMMCFLIEFLSMNFEKEWLAFTNSRKSLHKITGNTALNTLLWPLLKLYAHSTIGYALLGFELFHYSSYGEIFRNTWFSLIVIYFSWPIIHVILKMIYPKDRPSEDTATAHKPAAHAKIS